MKTVFKNSWVITMNEQYDILQGAYVCVDDGRITYVGKNPPDELTKNAKIIDCGDLKVIMPGFVNGHTHIPMTLMRGNAEGLPLKRWLEEKIYPMFKRDTFDTMYWGSMLGIAEMIRSGITTINDMSPTILPGVKALESGKQRAILSMGIMGSEANSLNLLKTNVELFEEYNGTQNGRLQIAVGPHAEYTSNIRFLEECSRTAKEIGARIHVHTSETYSEHTQCIERHGGKTPIELFESLGMFRSRMLLAHCVWASDHDIEIIKKNDAAILHCPASNLKLGSGIARVPYMLEQNIKISLSTDSAVSNNKLDLWDEMRLAALLYKGVTNDATVLNAHEALYIGTKGSALALGYTDLGSIEVGNKADIILVNIQDSTNYYPMSDLVNNIVYSGCSQDIVLTMVDGEILYQDGKYKYLDIEEILSNCQTQFDKAYHGI